MILTVMGRPTAGSSMSRTTPVMLTMATRFMTQTVTGSIWPPSLVVRRVHPIMLVAASRCSLPPTQWRHRQMRPAPPTQWRRRQMLRPSHVTIPTRRSPTRRIPMSAGGTSFGPPTRTMGIRMATVWEMAPSGRISGLAHSCMTRPPNGIRATSVAHGPAVG